MSQEKYSGKYRIESNRLKGYDYSTEGAYFITICTTGMKKVMGTVRNGKFEGNIYSEIAIKCWNDLSFHYDNCILDQFVIMPNHIHGIIILIYPKDISFEIEKKETGLRPVSTEVSKRYPVSELIRAFKSFSTRKINLAGNTKGISFWQKNYYDRIIRSEREFERIREYIYFNPLRWEWDRNNFEKTVLNRKSREKHLFPF